MAKKDFTEDNPAYAFLKYEKPKQKQEEANISDISDTIKSNKGMSLEEQVKKGYISIKKPNKDRRVQVLMTPLMHKQLKNMAKAKKVSTNSFINGILEEYISKNLKGAKVKNGK